MVERKTQGNVNEKGYIAVPQRMEWSLNASHDYIVEDDETVSNPDEAPWQTDKDWLKGVKLNAFQEQRWSESRQVLEYARTAQGQWYAKKILGTRSSSQADTSKPMWIVHLDTEREIPNDLFDQAKVKDRLDYGQVPYLQAFDQAIAKIDNRTTWPATPEEVAQAYLEAGAQSHWDEVAVLCPGSGATDPRIGEGHKANGSSAREKLPVRIRSPYTARSRIALRRIGSTPISSSSQSRKARRDGTTLREAHIELRAVHVRAAVQA